MPEEVATLRLTAKDETAAAFQAAALNLHRVKTASDDFHRSNQQAFERGKRSVELFGMSLERALSSAAIVEFGRRSYEAFANFDRAVTMTRLNTGATQEQMAKLNAVIDQLQKTTRQTNDALIAGFNTYMQTSGQTFDQAMAIFPKIAAAATATQNDINSVATAIGAAARNLHLTTAQQAQALDQLALAATMNMRDLGQYLPELTNALRGLGAAGPEAFQSILSALMTIRGGFGSTAEAVGALEQAMRAVTQSRDKGFAALGREIERRVKDGQDFVVAMMQVLEANNLLTDQALRRFLGRGGPALLALQQLRDMWKENRENFEALGRAQGEVERRNKEINQDAKAAAESLAIAFHNMLEEVGKFLAVTGVPKALTDTAESLHTANELIATIREGIEGKGLDWQKFFGIAGLDRMFEHFTVFWKLRWQRVKDAIWEGITPGGKVGLESPEAQRLREQLDWIEREMNAIQGTGRNIMGPLKPPAPAPGPAHTITGRPYRFTDDNVEGGGGGFRPNMAWAEALSGEASTNIEDRRSLVDAIRPFPTDEQLWSAIGAFNPYTKLLSLGSRTSWIRNLLKESAPEGGASVRKDDELTDALEAVTGELKRLNDFNDAHDPLRAGAGPGAPAGAYGFYGGGASGSGGVGYGLTGYGPGGQGGAGAMGGVGGLGGPSGGSRGANFLGSAEASALGIKAGPGQNLTTVQTAAGPITVNRAAAADMKGFVDDLVAAGAPVGNIGSYNMRRIAGSQRWSQHAYGGAMDIGNQTARNVVSPQFRAWVNANPEKWREILQRRNMISGGDWRNPDLGHVEWAGPARDGGQGLAQQEGGVDVAGRQTWFNPRPYVYTDQYGNRWFDAAAASRREGPHASGLPIATAGFASAGRQGLGGWYELTLPDGRKVVTQKTDIGPAGVVDLNAALASSVYGSRRAAERGGRITGRYLGRALPEGVRPGLQDAHQRQLAAEQDRGRRDVPDVAEIPKNVADLRAALEKPIRMHIEAPEVPSRFTPRIRRASAANVQNRELHRERERTYADMEE